MEQNAWTKHDHILVALVSQYQTMAMVHLGKIQNPMTGELDRDLDQARAMIDVLEMLKVKCRSETPDDLVRFLDGAVLDLQLNYMDELKKDKAGPAADTPDAACAAEEGPAANDSAAAAGGATQEPGADS